MAKVVGDIAVEVSADITSLQRGLDRGGKAVADFGSKAEKMAATLATVTKGVAAVGFAAAGAVATLSTVTRGIAETGDAAKRAGVNFGDFQRLGYVASQNRISVDALTDGIKEMQLRVDEFVVTGAGSASEALVRMGFEARDLKDRLEDPSELFLEITKRLEDFDAAAQIRIADEVFGGTAGERFVELLAQGESAIRATMRSADDLGVVLGDDVLTKAVEIDRKFAELQARLSTFGKIITINIADALIEAFDGDRVGGAITQFEQRLRLLGEIDISPVGDGAAGELENLAASYEAASTSAIDLAGSIRDTAFNLGNSGYVDAALDLDRMASSLDDTVAAFRAGQIDAGQFRVELERVTTEAGNTVTALGDINGVDLSGIVTKIGAVVSALKSAATQAVKTKQAIDGAIAADAELTQGPQNGRPSIRGRRLPTDAAPGSSLRPQLPGVDASFGVPIPTGGGGGGGSGSGGGGGLPGLSREDFEAFAETLATEGEKLEIWREEQLEKLAEFRGAKLATEGEFNELEAAIQQEHGDRLADLEGKQRADRMRAIAGAFGDLSSLMSTENEKLFKIGKAAAIAEATVSGYQAAVSAWEKGMSMPGGGPGMAAAFTAASLARTGAMISSIASQQIGGGGSSSGGGGSSSAPAAAQTQTVSEIRFMGNLGANGESLVKMINDEYERGNYVRAVVG